MKEEEGRRRGKQLTFPARRANQTAVLLRLPFLAHFYLELRFCHWLTDGLLLTLSCLFFLSLKCNCRIHAAAQDNCSHSLAARDFRGIARYLGTMLGDSSDTDGRP